MVLLPSHFGNKMSEENTIQENTQEIEEPEVEEPEVEEETPKITKKVKSGREPEGDMESTLVAMSERGKKKKAAAKKKKVTCYFTVAELLSWQ